MAIITKNGIVGLKDGREKIRCCECVRGHPFTETLKDAAWEAAKNFDRPLHIPFELAEKIKEKRKRCDEIAIEMQIALNLGDVDAYRRLEKLSEREGCLCACNSV